MTTTFLAVIALVGPLAPGARPEFQAQTDYGQAMKVATTEKKPMAVLIGKGDVFARMMADAGLTAEAKKLLSEKYVCVAVDVGTEAGKALAGQFQMAEGGLVISSVGGTHQAFRQAGAVTAADLSRQAATYASAGAVPSTTVTAGTVISTSTPTYVPSGSIAPASYSAPAYSPSTFAPSTYYPSNNFGFPQQRFGTPGCVGGT